MLNSQKQAREANRQRKQENLANRKRLEAAAPSLLTACEEGRKRLVFLHNAIRNESKVIFDYIEIRKTGDCIIFVDEAIAKTKKP